MLVRPIRSQDVAASEAAKEIVWIKMILTELQVVPNVELPLPLYCDNNGSIVQAKEQRFHNNSKHIERWYFIIREIVGRGDVATKKNSYSG